MEKSTQCRGGVYHRTESFLGKCLVSCPWFAVGHVAQVSGSPLTQVVPRLRGHHLSESKVTCRYLVTFWL